MLAQFLPTADRKCKFTPASRFREQSDFVLLCGIVSSRDTHHGL